MFAAAPLGVGLVQCSSSAHMIWALWAGGGRTLILGRRRPSQLPDVFLCAEYILATLSLIDWSWHDAY